MKKTLLSVAIAMAALSLQAADVNYNVVPLPQSITAEKGNAFVLTGNTPVYVASTDEAMLRNGNFLKQYIREATGIEANGVDQKGATITLKLNAKIANDEGYIITVKAKGVTIEGKTPQGVFYGIQTLRKSLPLEKVQSVSLPAARIVDQPRFGYRGAMLDCARHYFNLEFVKEFVEIDRYPKLIEVGSKRDQTVVGHNSPVFDGTPYGGHYTKEEMKEIVKYAAERYITVIPEIDMPGHMLGALAAYPELGCTGGPYKVAQQWGVFDDILCAGNPKTYEFVNNVLDEIIEIFPSKYIHLGGDEAPRKRWKAEAQLQGHFLSKVAKHLESKGRHIIGWDEILEGDVEPGTTVMSWRGVAGGITAANRGLDAIMSPNDYHYLDHYQNKSRDLLLIGGNLPVEKTYGYNPVPDDATPALKKHVKGVQVNLWTEYIACKELAEYQLLPRLAAMAETGWTENSKKDYNSFKQREGKLNQLYKQFGWKACQDMFENK